MTYRRCKHINPVPWCKHCPTAEVDIDLEIESGPANHH